jgi:hypothetical protein
MPSRNTRRSSLRLSWAAVLDDVAKMLHKAEAEARRSEQDLLDTPSLPNANTAVQPYYERLEERFRDMQQCLARAEQVAAVADAACRSSEETLTAWLDQSAAARQKLATTTTAGI